jgi:hypothetical protein
MVQRWGCDNTISLGAEINGVEAAHNLSIAIPFSVDER